MPTCMFPYCETSTPGYGDFCAEHKPKRNPFTGATVPTWWKELPDCACGWSGKITPAARGQRCPNCGSPLD